MQTFENYMQFLVCHICGNCNILGAWFFRMLFTTEFKKWVVKKFRDNFLVQNYKKSFLILFIKNLLKGLHILYVYVFLSGMYALHLHAP